MSTGILDRHRPPTDAEMGLADIEPEPCVCDHDLADHAQAPDLPCAACDCEVFREDLGW